VFEIYTDTHTKDNVSMLYFSIFFFI